MPGLGRKFVRYEYDLISNKVLQVAYQEGQPDQFFHRYRYDDDNRLLAVQTSADGQVWEQDAEYSYYPHGPLKRLTLGDDHVQALDYTYTLQGWLKAINHPNLSTTQAVTQAAGRDGQSNGVAADAFGMTLGYYQGDYVRTGTYLSAATGTAAARGVLAPTQQQELFNGNIATWSTRSLEHDANGQQIDGTAAGEAFRYDQLNRLLSSARSTVTGNGWNANARYATAYAYDANGNLAKLDRRANNQNKYLDQLEYKYKLTSDGQPSNRLTSVKDAVGAGESDEDVDSQPDDNYDYDGVGNLIRDNQAGVNSITWTPYGKIARVAKSNGATTTYLYDAQGNRIRKVWAPTAATASTTYYVRDAQGNILAVYEQTASQPLRLTEQPLYGSTRLGLRKPGTLSAPPTPGVDGATYARVLGQKFYELTDHLGNVRAVVTDEKSSTLSTSTGQPLASSLRPKLSAYYNYYPFGQLQPSRYTATSTPQGGYRFGYNGKEKDNNGELGDLTNYDYGFRIYNPGIGRFLSVDPLSPKYPHLTPYQFSSNNPIFNIDIDGLEGGEYLLITDKLHEARATMSNSERERVDKAGLFTLGMFALPLLAQGGGALIVTVPGAVNATATLRIGLSGASILYRYGADIANFAYGATTGDVFEPFPSSSGAQSSDAGAALQKAFSKGDAVLDFFGGKVSKYKNGVSIDPVAIKGFRGTIDQFAKVFKGSKFFQIIADNPQGDLEYLKSAGDLLESGGTITIRGTMGNKFFNKVVNGTMEGLENFDVVQQITRLSDEAKAAFRKSDGTPLKGDVYEMVLKRK